MNRTTKLLVGAAITLLAVGFATASATAFGGANDGQAHDDVQTHDDPANVAVTLDGDAASLEPANDEPVDNGGGGGDDDAAAVAAMTTTAAVAAMTTTAAVAAMTTTAAVAAANSNRNRSAETERFFTLRRLIAR